MCCSGKPYHPLKVNETLENSFSIAASADLPSLLEEEKPKIIKSNLTREDFNNINFKKKIIRRENK
jgi:hypothetical protein